MPELNIKSILALLLQLRLIKQTNRTGISMRSEVCLLLNTVAVKTNNPKAANECDCNCECEYDSRVFLLLD